MSSSDNADSADRFLVGREVRSVCVFVCVGVGVGVAIIARSEGGWEGVVWWGGGGEGPWEVCLFQSAGFARRLYMQTSHANLRHASTNSAQKGRPQPSTQDAKP